MLKQSALTIRLGGLLQPTERSISSSWFATQAHAATAAVAHNEARRTTGEIGFWDLAEPAAAVPLLQQIQQYISTLPAHIDTMVVLGIGGSSLGPRALHSALADTLQPNGRPALRLLFADNIDPVTFSRLLIQVDVARTVWNVVTKSGGTAETAAQFLIVAQMLTDTLGHQALANHMVCTTDPQKGALRAAATQLGLPTFAVPASVGGRFSVLTAVGLLPAAAAGVDIAALLAGAAAMRQRVLSPSLSDNPALALATLLTGHQLVGKRPIVVMMSYADGLYDLADWFRQLWAESLGKEFGTNGARLCIGPTPIAARGATDQHSQLQLYAEGPDDKAYLFLSVKHRANDVQIPSSALAHGQAEYGYLAGRSLGELLDAEYRGTVAALRQRQRPVGELQLAHQDAYSVGQLIMLLEAATALAGSLCGVDPFDQPGVEQAKRIAFAALGRPGYDQYAMSVPSPGTESDSDEYTY